MAYFYSLTASNICILWLFSLNCVVLSADNSIDEVEDEGKIVGGFEANKADYPYAVSLRTDNNHHFCGGTLIDSRHVVTAAHCIVEGYSINVVVGSDSLDKGGDRYPVLSTHVHPDFDPKLIRNDIAILKIADNTYKSSYPARAITSLSDYDNPCYVMGWGRVKAGGKLSKKFKVATVHPVKPADCEREWQERYNPKLICTSSKDNAACNGDSGGPLICEEAFAGVVSFGKPCATGKPDMFTAVSAYNEWIEKIVQEDN